ncbi:protease modulator HflC [Thorsellia anophelis]|uniref:Protein HflC n=1 Tax=Thorsellia anophelis DSM 18579 TaxID=1123402 RepID=A0A1I0BC79_9GAMM|nr:protease modulator HflC [Thorsellia anophelis]SET04373.1 membrane protease subunit HflC [Thorsellia anophelis DSM 18579]
MRGSLIVVFVLALIGAYNSLFVISEGTRGIVLEFNRVLRDDAGEPRVYEPGLHVKVPFIQSVKVLDARIQTMTTAEQRFITRESKHLIVDSFLKWRITDFGRYYTITGGNSRRAEEILRPRLSDRLRSEFGRLDVKEIVRDSRSRFTAVRDILNSGANEASDDDIVDGALSENTVDPNTRMRLSEIGIEVVDVRIKKINLPEEISEAIFNNMRAERRAVATRHRAQGEEAAVRIRSETDRETTVIKSEAAREGQILIGEGDALAAKIFADAFNQDTEFYSFIRSLRAYENTFKQNQDMMVLSPESEFYRYMKQPNSTTQN